MRVSVPPAHQPYAASYRFGHSDATHGNKPKTRARFSTDAAWAAYQAGFAAGTVARRADAGAATIGGPLFEPAEGGDGRL